MPLRTYQRYEAGQLPVKKPEHQTALAVALGVHVRDLVSCPETPGGSAETPSTIVGDIVLDLARLNKDQLSGIRAVIKRTLRNNVVEMKDLNNKGG